LFGGAEDLADADLFCALQDGIGGESEEAEAGDEDGEGGEEAEDLAEAGVCFVLFVKGFVEEVIVEGILGEVAVPGLFYRGDGLMWLCGGEFYGVVATDVGDAQDEHGV